MASEIKYLSQPDLNVLSKDYHDVLPLKVDISCLTKATSTRNYEKILDNNECFWLLFCKATAPLENRDIKTSFKGSILTLEGKQNVIS